MSKYDRSARCGQPTDNDPYKKVSCCQRRITVADIKFDSLKKSSPKVSPTFFPSADLAFPQSNKITGTNLYNPLENSSYLDPTTGEVHTRSQWERKGKFDVMSTQRARVRMTDESDMPKRRLIRV